MPRTFTLVSRCLRSPTPCASVCISPRPRCTISSRSATCLKLSPSRACKVDCSFSSTVWRISSSLALLLCCSCAICSCKVPRISASRRALASLKASSCWLSVSDTCFCICAKPACTPCNCWACVRADSALCCTSPVWNVLKACACSCRVLRAVSASSRRSSRSSRSLLCSMVLLSSCRRACCADVSGRRSHKSTSTTRLAINSAASSTNIQEREASVMARSGEKNGKRPMQPGKMARRQSLHYATPQLAAGRIKNRQSGAALPADEYSLCGCMGEPTFIPAMHSPVAHRLRGRRACRLRPAAPGQRGWMPGRQSARHGLVRLAVFGSGHAQG